MTNVKRVQTTVTYYNGTRYVHNRGQAFLYVTAQNGNTNLAWTGRHGEYTARYTMSN